MQLSRVTKSCIIIGVIQRLTIETSANGTQRISLGENLG